MSHLQMNRLDLVVVRQRRASRLVASAILFFAGVLLALAASPLL